MRRRSIVSSSWILGISIFGGAPAIAEEGTPASRSSSVASGAGQSDFVGDHAAGYAQRSIGLSGGVARAGQDAPLGHVAAHERGVGLLSGDWVSVRYFDELWIGAGGGGVTYSLSGHLAVGVRRDLLYRQGPLARLSLRGEMKRRGGVYSSFLRLPGLELGWGGTPSGWIFEVVGHAGPSWTGRLRKRGVIERDVRGLVSGGAFSLGWDRIQAHGDVSHLFTGGPFLLDARADVCSLWGKKKPGKSFDSNTSQSSLTNGPRAMDYRWAVCSDVSFLKSGPGAGASGFEQWSLGFSLVVGQFSRLDPPAEP